MALPQSKTGLLQHADGSTDRVRLYYGADEEDPPPRMPIDPENYTAWIEDDGAIGLRRGTSVSIGASPAYSANYDALDWGN